MDIERFHYLFVNAGSLAELALRGVAAELDLDAPESSEAQAPVQTLTDEELAASFENLDFDALGDIGGYDMPGAAQADDSAEPVASGDMPVPGVVPDVDVEAGKLNYEQYVNRACLELPAQHPRVAAALSRADVEKLGELVAALPPDLAPITGRLTTDELEAWLNRYRADDEAVTALVVYARQLDQ